MESRIVQKKCRIYRVPCSNRFSRFFGITSPVDDIFSVSSPSPDPAGSPNFWDCKWHGHETDDFWTKTVYNCTTMIKVYDVWN